MPIVPKILQFSGNLFSARIRVAEVHERTDHFLHALVVFKKHVSLFLELGTALRMGVAIGSRQGRVEVPGGMVEINGCRSDIYNSINNLQAHYRWYVTHCR